MPPRDKLPAVDCCCGIAMGAGFALGVTHPPDSKFFALGILLFFIGFVADIWLVEIRSKRGSK